MQLPDGTILMHGRAPYDPVKAHQYYLRTRELKGRKRGQEPGRPTLTRSPTYTVKTQEGGQVHLTAQQLAEQRAYAAHRVASVKKRLGELKAKLREMVAEANRSKAEAEKEPTAAEKSKAARESKKYREKHQQEISTKRKTEESAKPEPKKDPVAELEQKITKVKSSLTAAVARQRLLASATKSSN